VDELHSAIDAGDASIEVTQPVLPGARGSAASGLPGRLNDRRGDDGSGRSWGR
jgi:hypothetical protein